MPLLLMSQAVLPQTVLGVHASAWLDAVMLCPQSVCLVIQYSLQ